MGIEYEEGVKIQPNCSSKCTCYRGAFHCEEQDCTIDRVVSCHAYGGLHFQTFDKSSYQFQGRCEYVFVQPCSHSNFSVTIVTGAQTENIYNIETVKVVVTNSNESTTVVLGRGDSGTITINGNQLPNNGDEVLHQSDEMKVVRVGGHPHILLIANSIDLFWDGQYHLSVTVSQVWRGKLCGLCGNYNNDSSDDLLTHSGSLASNPSEFAISWQSNNSMIENCHTSDNSPTCPHTIASEALLKCDGFLLDEFTTCHRVVNPNSFNDACLDDYCLSNEQNRQDLYCSSLITYAAACAAQNIVLPTWRYFNCCKSTKMIVKLPNS